MLRRMAFPSNLPNCASASGQLVIRSDSEVPGFFATRGLDLCLNFSSALRRRGDTVESAIMSLPSSCHLIIVQFDQSYHVLV